MKKMYFAAVAALGTIADGRPLLVASIGAKADVKEWGDIKWTELFSRLGKRA